MASRGEKTLHDSGIGDTNSPSLDEDTVTAEDILRAQIELERDAAEILPGSFDRCTIHMGPIRQSVYACLTCSPKEPRGLCYACSIACHADHQLVELFYRRRFICDCGHGLMPHPCQLTHTATSDEGNAVTVDGPRNGYDHNYLGRFCRCDTTYDPEEESGTMYQCVVCEDWFHDRCMDQMPDSPDDFEEFCCHTCVERMPFLERYALPIARLQTSDEASQDTKPTENTSLKRTLDDTSADDSTLKTTPMKRARTNEDTCVDQVKDSVCRLSSWSRPTTASSQHVDLFFAEGWRDRLCRCTSCMDMYREKDVLYLLAEETTYEPEKDKTSECSLFELGLKELANMDRTKAINGILAYNRMRDELRSFLEPFAANGMVVTKSAVNAFFEEKIRKLSQQNR